MPQEKQGSTDFRQHHNDAIKEAVMNNENFGIRKFTIQTVHDWMEYSGVFLSDVVNEDDTLGIKLGGVGFLRASKGAHTTFEFPYDEVLVVTRGICTVQMRDEAITARAGNVIYLVAGTLASFHADENTELVYVASSSCGDLNREAHGALTRH
jgi:ethanolamine utilization protein EutQ (cupin superfamily)